MAFKLTTSYRSGLYAPLVASVIQASQGLKNPTANSVITQITRSLHEATLTSARAVVPTFVNAHLDDPNVVLMMERIALAKAIAGGFSAIKSWNTAWEWLLHAAKVIREDKSGPRGVDETVVFVFYHVLDLQREISFEWLATSLGYCSVEEANSEGG